MNNQSFHNVYWRGIQSFLLVAEHGSFTAAAEATGMSKANLSQHVTELEARLGVQLLYRTTRQLRLTEIGVGYFERCKRASQQLTAATEWASQSTDDLKGTIRLNTVGGPIGEDLIAPLVIQFQKEHSGITIQLDFSSVRVDLIEDHYDLVIRMGNLPDSTLIANKLHTITTRYVASPDFVATHPLVQHPEDLKSLPLIYGSVEHWTLSNGAESHTVQADNGFKVLSGRVMRQAALAGMGIARTADVYVQADVNAGRLVEVLPDWSETTPLYLVCPPLQHQLNRVRTLMNWLKHKFPAQYQKALSGE